LPIPDLNYFLFDRIWILVIPEPYTMPSRKKKKCSEVNPNYEEVIKVRGKDICLVRNKLKQELIREIIDKKRGYWGKKWSDNAWTMYRTLLGIQLALKRVDKGLMRREDITPERVVDLLKYGEKEIFSFEQKDGKFCVKISYGLEGEVSGIAKFISTEKCFSEDQIRSLGYREYSRKGKIYGEIVYKYNDYITILIRPYPESMYEPHFIRVMINAIKWTKKKLGIDIDMSSIFEYEHDNFIDFSLLSEDKVNEFLKVNHGILFDLKKEVLDLINDLLETWFGPSYMAFKWIPKISTVEIAYDSYEPKERLVGYGFYVEGEMRSTKASWRKGKKDKYHENTYQETKLGLKLYLLIKGGRYHLQMKVYTKAFNKVKNMALNRLEYTVGIHENFKSLKFEDVFRKDLVEVHNVVMRVSKLESNAIVDLLKDKLQPFLRECENYSFYDRCVDFWIDMIIANGNMKGISYYEDVAKLYKQKGFIKIRGRGRNSKYIVSDNYCGIVKMLKELVDEYLGIFTKNIKPSTQPPPQQ